MEFCQWGRVSPGEPPPLAGAVTATLRHPWPVPLWRCPSWVFYRAHLIRAYVCSLFILSPLRGRHRMYPGGGDSLAFGEVPFSCGSWPRFPPQVSPAAPCTSAVLLVASASTGARLASEKAGIAALRAAVEPIFPLGRPSYGSVFIPIGCFQLLVSFLGDHTRVSSVGGSAFREAQRLRRLLPAANWDGPARRARTPASRPLQVRAWPACR